ncbi:MAG TPA: hypothetical protein VLX56_05680 [Nitrososphaerales archaeon]|nr:hypothetical protein [Nitrososphaerales archaeon]
MSFWVDPPALFMFGAFIWIVAERLESPRSVVYAISGATIASFTIGGIGLYLDWYHWIIPGLVNLKGSYVMLDQGITGLTEATFPAWMALLLLSLYPFWFAVGYEFAKKHRWQTRTLLYLAVGILLMLTPSIIEAQLLPH